MSSIVTTVASSDNGFDNISIIVPVVLGTIIVLLVIALAISACLFLKKRRKLCFRDIFDDQKTVLLGDKRRKTKPRQFNKKNPKPGKPKPKKKRKPREAKYHSLGRAPPRFKTDPFANVEMNNPLEDNFELEEDWSNPLFDSEKAAARDAAICIQSWYRMIRYLNV